MLRLPAYVHRHYVRSAVHLTCPLLQAHASAWRIRRARPSWPLLFFVFAWSTLVYDPIAYWTWNANGWGNELGNIDFVVPEEIWTGVPPAALTISFLLKKRRGYGTAELAYVPHNTTYVVLGTVFLWLVGLVSKINCLATKLSNSDLWVIDRV